MNNTAELLRLINNVIRIGTIAEVDHAAARVRVTVGELITAWLPWLESRAGTTRTWSPPTMGEQVVLFSPGGDLAAAVVLAGLYRQTHPAPSGSPGKWHAVMPDGAIIEYDHQAHHLQASLPGSATIKATGAITLESAADINLTAAGNIALSAARIDLN